MFARNLSFLKFNNKTLFISSRVRNYSSMSQRPVIVNPIKKHVGTVIFIHGLGDSGYGWSDAMEMIQPKTPHIKFILPHAPQRRITINGGEKMPGWYDIASLSIGNRADDVEGLNESKATINSIIEDEIKAGISPKNIIVGGFSQGAVMSLYTLFQFPQTLGGCLVLSGYVPVAATFSSLINSSNAQTPILMYHGEADAVVPYAMGKKSCDLLKQCGLNVEFVNVPGMPHTATEPELLHAARFINQIIPPAYFIVSFFSVLFVLFFSFFLVFDFRSIETVGRLFVCLLYLLRILIQ